MHQLWVGGFEIPVTQCMSNGIRVFACKKGFSPLCRDRAPTGNVVKMQH